MYKYSITIKYSNLLVYLSFSLVRGSFNRVLDNFYNSFQIESKKIQTSQVYQGDVR